MNIVTYIKKQFPVRFVKAISQMYFALFSPQVYLFNNRFLLFNLSLIKSAQASD